MTKRKKTVIKDLHETPKQKRDREQREHALAQMRIADSRLESPLGGGRVRPVFYDEDSSES